MEPEKTNDPDVCRVRDAAHALIEYFDSVLILCSRHEAAENNGTVAVKVGLGNEFAQYGQAKNWVRVCEETGLQQVEPEEH